LQIFWRQKISDLKHGFVIFGAKILYEKFGCKIDIRKSQSNLFCNLWKINQEAILGPYSLQKIISILLISFCWKLLISIAL